MTISFSGTAVPLTKTGFDAATQTNDIGDATLWAVLSVETSGCGFLPDKRPKILFERHIFHRLTGGKFDSEDPDVSAPSPGGYGAAGAHQYLRLQAAMDLDGDAALRSASWGLGQILGDNCSSSGFESVDEMVTSMVASEDNQLRAVANFINSTGMDQPLRRYDWAGFARRYNGANYAANNYDGLLQHFYERYASGNLPNLIIRTVQMYLMFRGFSPGGIDGLNGTNTANAIKAFQMSIGATPTGVIDEELLATLVPQRTEQ
jgi:hypothetical protein